MKSFFWICVLSALAAVGTTQPNHNSPHHDAGQTQHHTQSDYHMSQLDHRMSHPERHMSRPQHGFENWPTANAQAKYQTTFISPEHPQYQAEDILRQSDMVTGRHHIVHPQPQHMDPQVELIPNPYQHSHYTPTRSHHMQDPGPIEVQPTYGWNMQNPVYQLPLPEAPVPEHHINSFKEDHQLPNQYSASANAVAFSSNNVPVTNHEQHPQLYKMISMPKADHGADYIMPVADHETRQPEVFQTSNVDDLPDIVQKILAKYRNKPIEIKAEPIPENNAPSHKEHKPEGNGPVRRPHEHKKHKGFIPLLRKQTSKVKAVPVAKTDTNKTYIITGGKASTDTKAPIRHKHKHSHKKILKPLFDPELLAKELDLLSKELWARSPDKTHEKDIPCDDNPIVTDAPTNSDDDGSNYPDKNEPKDKPKDKNYDKKHSHISADLDKDILDKMPPPSSYIEPFDKKDDKDTDCDSASLQEASEPYNDDSAPETEDTKEKHKRKPVDPKIANSDFKKKELVQKIKVKKELTKKVELKEEEIEQSETKTYDGKQHPKKGDQNDADKDTDSDSASNDKPIEQPYTPIIIVPNEETKPTEPNTHVKPGDQKGTDRDTDCESTNFDENAKACDDPETENRRKKHEPKPKTEEKQNNDPDKINPKNKPLQHHHNKHARPYIPQNIIPKKDEPNTHVKSAANSDENTEACDDPETENGRKKHVSKPKTEDKQNNDPNKVNPKNKPPQHHHNKHAQPYSPPNIVPKKDKPNTHVKPGDQKSTDRGSDCESGTSDEPCDKDNAPEKDDKQNEHLPRSKTDNKIIVNSKPVDNNKENIDTTTNKKVIEKKEEDIRKVQIKKNETIDQPEKNKQQPEAIDEKPKPVEQYDSTSDCESTESKVPQKPSDKTPDPGYNRELKEPQPISNKDNKVSKVLSKFKKIDIKEEESVKVEAKTKKSTKTVVSSAAVEETKPTEPNTHVKPGDQKGTDRDTDCESTNFDENTKACDDPETENGRKKHEPKPKTEEKQNNDPDKINQKNKPLQHHHNKHARPYIPQNIIPKKDELNTHVKSAANSDENTEACDDPETENGRKKHVSKPKTEDKQNNDPDKINPKNKPPQHHHNNHAQPYSPPNIVPKKDKPNTHVKPGDQKGADIDTDCESANSGESTEDCDDPETENERKQHVPKPKTEDKQNNDPDKINPKNKPPQHHHNKHAQPYSPPNIVPKKDKPNTHVKPGDQKSTDRGSDCESGTSNEPCDKDNAPEKDDKQKQHLPRYKTDNKIIVNSKPVDNNKENIDTTTNKKVIEKKEEDIRKVQIKKNETIDQPEKNKQQPEAIDDKPKPVEQYDSTSDCESTESKVPQKPSDKTPDPGYNRELKEPQPISNKDNKVSKVLSKFKKIGIKKEESVKVEAKTKKSTKNVVSSAAVDKPVEKSNKNSDIDDYDSADSETDPNLNKTGTIKEKHDPKKEKPEKKSSDIEDCDSTESEVPQKPSDKTPDPRYNRELKEPQPISNKDNKVSKVLSKFKKIDIKKEESVKVEAKTKKSTKNVVSSAAVDKPVEKSNKNSDIDDYDSADSETDPNLDKTGTIKEKHDPKTEKQEKNSSDNEDCDSTESTEPQKSSDKTPDPGYNTELKEHLPKSYKDNKVSKVLTKLKKIDIKKEETVKVEAKTKKSTKNVVSSAAVDKPVEKSNENSEIEDCDPADSETIKENHDPKKDKTKEFNKKQVIKAKSKAEGKGEQLTSAEVHKILETTETDQPLSTVGFLFSLISHALQGSDSVKQMFEEPKVKTYLERYNPVV